MSRNAKLATSVAAGLIILAVPLYLGFLKPNQDRESYRIQREQSMANLFELSQAISKYRRDNGAYPTAENWMDQLRVYIPKERANPFANPFINGGDLTEPGWAYNILVSDLKEDMNVEEHGGYILVSQRNAPKNATFDANQPKIDTRYYQGQNRTINLSLYLVPYPCYMEGNYCYPDRS
ncbi:MAG: type II secretion system protein GspG [Fimbriimonadaceae bacterium]|nr:type II secretion system protein GspG [Fimbriimonadaceae bacterium]